MPTANENITVDGSSMRTYVSTPEGEGPFPAVVVIQHASGVDDFIRSFTDRLAKEGYVAAAPNLYHREEPGTADDAMGRMGRLKDQNIVKDINTCIRHLSAQNNVRSDRVGITGFCMGGRVAYLMPSMNPELKASVVFYGGNTMEQWGESPTPFDLTSKINCPIMGLFGEEDGNPSPSDVKRIDEELTRHGVTHEFHSYSGAGHGFMGTGRPAYREGAATLAWSKTLEWFQKYLKS